MVGFLAVLIPILSLGLGGVELAHWMSLRQTLSLALMDAARAGATRQASPRAIAEAFEQGLRQIYPQPAALTRALQTRRQRLDIPWRIHILQPAPAAFLDHADAFLDSTSRHPGQALIRNDYQSLQQARRIRQGWPQGRGPQSGTTIFQANTLLMDLWWPQAPMLPGVAAVVRALAPMHGDPIGRQMMQNGYLPFRRRIRMVMQSHPAAWPDLPDGRVVHAESGDVVPPADRQTGSPPIGNRPLDSQTDKQNEAPSPPDKEKIGAAPIDTTADPRDAPDGVQDGANAGADTQMPGTCAPG